MADDVRFMYDEALARLHDADILARSVSVQSDSGHLLRVLAFEVLLKCALRLCGKDYPKTHSYERMWCELPPAAQADILSVARNRMPGHADLSRVEPLLRQYEYYFNKVRYYYELYEGFTAEQRHAVGERWIEHGAPDDEADVVYRSNELECLTAGLREFIEGNL